MIRPLRRPLIVMTPKSLLRHRLSVSPLADLTDGGFHGLLDDTRISDAGTVDRIVLCTGKVYFDLDEERTRRDQQTTAIVRIEQLYPLPQEALDTMLARYPNCKTVVWCQEEPRNQGSWHRIQNHLARAVSDGQDLEHVSRDASASPAVGYYQKHVEQQEQLVAEALGPEPTVLAATAVGR